MSGPERSGDGRVVQVPDAKICLSTSSVYPESTGAAFEIAAALGFDGVEVMVGVDPISQDPKALRHLSDYHGMPITAIHAPCLLITQRVWGTDPWGKLQRAQAVSEELGATTVVVHPPFRWQREYAKAFETGLARMKNETDVAFAVENMYPWKAGTRQMQAYAPDWDIVDRDYPEVTLDLSHTSVSHSDPLRMIEVLGDRLRHLHLADGSGTNKDEHLIPGRGTQPCVQVLEQLSRQGFTGNVVLEVNTRRCANRAEREADLIEALAFTRLHLASSV
ncbi:MAG: sugar phosphate isomerase/epimerase family protein [Sporichthyaceae bacterium]